MLVLLAIPVIVTVVFVHRFIQVVAPSNLLVRIVRSARPRWRLATALLGLAAALLLTMHVVENAVSAGGPGWLNLLVLVLAWNAMKFAWTAVLIVMRMLGRALRRRDRRFAPEAILRTTSGDSIRQTLARPGPSGAATGS